MLGLSGAALVAALLVAAALPRDLLPRVDQGAFTVRLEMPQGTGLEATADATHALEDALLKDPDVAAVFSRVGRDVQAFAGDDAATGLNTASLDVQVADGRATDAVVRRLRPSLTAPPGATLSVEEGGATALGEVLGESEADVAVRVRSEDLDAARARADTVAARLAGLDRLANVRVGSAAGTPQLRVEVLRDRAAAYGVAPLDVAEAVDRAIRGDVATQFVDFDRKIAVMVRYPDDVRRSLAALDAMRVGGVPLRELVKVEQADAPTEVRREDQGRVIPVYADVARGGLDDAVASVRAALAGLPQERGLRMDVGGENESMRKSFRDLAFAFGLAMVLVYMILAAQFESFVHPFTILTAVPLSLVGAVAALALTGEGLSTMSLIGVVILVGIVVNDAIVKVDFIRQAREAGTPLREAILEAGRARLRPILMTTVTTVLGLLPMALGLGAGADLRAPLAVTVIGGLSVATLLTLVVVPVVYAVVEDARVRLFGARRRPRPPRRPPPPGPRRPARTPPAPSPPPATEGPARDPPRHPPPRGRGHGVRRRGGAGGVRVAEHPPGAPPRHGAAPPHRDGARGRGRHPRPSRRSSPPRWRQRWSRYGGSRRSRPTRSTSRGWAKPRSRWSSPGTRTWTSPAWTCPSGCPRWRRRSPRGCAASR